MKQVNELQGPNMNDPKPKQMTKDQLKLLALKQRIGQITSDYEDQMADMRADATQQFDALQDVLRQQEAEIENLREQLNRYQETESDVPEQEDGKKSTK